MHQRQEKRQRLASSGLRAGHQVMPVEHTRKHGALDRCGRHEPAVCQRPLEVGVEAKRRERHRSRVVGRGSNCSGFVHARRTMGLPDAPRRARPAAPS